MAVTDRFITARELPASFRLPPGPRLPKAVQTVLFMGGRNIIGPYWQRTFGDVFAVHVAPAGRAVVLCRPEDVRAVFAGPADVFHAGEGNAILGPVMGEHSVLLLDEQKHLAARKRVMAAFHGEVTTAWADFVEELAAAAVARWPIDTPFPVHPELNDISLEVILRIVFGLTDSPRLDELRPLLRQLVQVGPVIFIGFFYPRLERIGPWRRFRELKERTDEVIYREIADRRTASDLAGRTDVLSRLLGADPTQSDEELRDHLVTLLLAGHETTASTLAWTFHDLARRPDVLARTQRAADANDAYLEAVIKESMRLRPVITSLARRLNKPATVAGYDLPAGVVVLPSVALVHRRAAVYPSPDQFRPERFLGPNPPPGTWIPFGGGIRRCLGAALAMVEAQAVLKAVVSRVDLAPGGRAEWGRTRNVTTVPARGARIAVRPRPPRA
jgi:cytochrome P450